VVTYLSIIGRFMRVLVGGALPTNNAGTPSPLRTLTNPPRMEKYVTTV